jgi:hypothetical protein
MKTPLQRDTSPASYCLPVTAWPSSRVVAGSDAFPARELVAIVLYVIVYEVAGAERVTILRVWHGAQERP